VKSRTTPDFWRCFDDLPENVQKLAAKSYKRWRETPHHPGLNFKRIHNSQEIFSVRIGIRWRAIGRLDDNVVTWFWIGSHSDYDRTLK